jgi:hypothetical protein
MVRLLSLYWLLLHINLEFTDNEECQSAQIYRSSLEPSTKIRVSVFQNIAGSAFFS